MKVCLFWLAFGVATFSARAETAWFNSQFGSPDSSGGAEWLQDGSLKITGSGDSHGSLALHYVYHEPPKTGSISTCVQLQAETAIGGVLVRFSGNDYVFIGSDGAGEIRIVDSAKAAVPVQKSSLGNSLWLKVSWNGGDGAAEMSSDGKQWEKIHSFHFNSPASAVGVGSSSTDGRPAIVLFSGVGSADGEKNSFSSPVTVHNTGGQNQKEGNGAKPLASSSSSILDIHRLKASDLPNLRYMHFAHLLPGKTGVLRFVDPLAGNDQWNGQGVEGNAETSVGPWKTIRSAINAAGDGDVIILKAGTHYTTGFASPPGKTVIVTSMIGAIMADPK